MVRFFDYRGNAFALDVGGRTEVAELVETGRGRVDANFDARLVSKSSTDADAELMAAGSLGEASQPVQIKG